MAVRCLFVADQLVFDSISDFRRSVLDFLSVGWRAFSRSNFCLGGKGFLFGILRN